MTRHERAVSPVVAVALLVAITVLLATVVSAAAFGLGLGGADAPAVTLSFAVVDGGVELRHEGGDALAADEVVVVDGDGAEVGGLDDDLRVGDRQRIVADADGIETIRVVWRAPDGGTSSVLATFRP